MDPLLVPITGILMPLLLVPTIITMKHRHRRREMEHRERMKAMELGLSNRPGQAPGDMKSIAWIGAGVPIASVIMAFLTCSEGPAAVEEVPLAAIVWSGAALISGGAMLTSLIMAFMVGRLRKTGDSPYAMNGAKPVYDPDAFDVVSSRG